MGPTYPVPCRLLDVGALVLHQIVVFLLSTTHVQGNPTEYPFLEATTELSRMASTAVVVLTTSMDGVARTGASVLTMALSRY